MAEAEKVIATRMIEPNLDLYDTFFDGDWAKELHDRAPAQLQDAVDNLFLT
jgi:hypothetical protein